MAASSREIHSRRGSLGQILQGFFVHFRTSLVRIRTDRANAGDFSFDSGHRDLVTDSEWFIAGRAEAWQKA